MILHNCRITFRDVADDVAMSLGSCEAIFTDVLGIKRAVTKIVTKVLKQCRMDIAQELLTTFNDDTDLL